MSLRQLVLLLVVISSLGYGIFLGFNTPDAYYFILLGGLAFVLLVNQLDFLKKPIRLVLVWLALILVFIHSLQFITTDSLIIMGIALVIMGVMMTFRILGSEDKSFDDKSWRK